MRRCAGSAALLVIAVGVLACRSRMPTPGPQAAATSSGSRQYPLTPATRHVSHLCFSPDSRSVAVTQTTADDGRWELFVVPAALDTEPLGSLTTTASPGAAWDREGKRSLWVTRHKAGGIVFAYLDADTGEDARQESSVFAGARTSRVAASPSGDLVTALVHGAGGEQRLVAWDDRSSELTDLPLPEDFVAHGESPPPSSLTRGR
jgi:hypothetical protein